MTRRVFFAVVVAASLPGFAIAADAPLPAPPAAPTFDKPSAVSANLQETCKQVLIPQGVREIIDANVNLSTRIQFPGNVGAYQVATPGLWDGSYRGDSFWIRPKTMAAAADKTSVTVFLQDARRYDFLINSVPEVPNTCVIVTDAISVSARKVVGVQSHTDRSNDQDIKKIKEADRGNIAAVAQNAELILDQQKDRYEHLLQEQRRQVESQATDRIKAFEYSVNTRYTWIGDTPADKNLVSAIYDDGRFTYVRIATSAFGLPALSGTLDDKDVVLQYQYDDLTGVYTILGLYDKLRVRLGTHKINVDREG